MRAAAPDVPGEILDALRHQLRVLGNPHALAKPLLRQKKAPGMVVGITGTLDYTP